jgi:hypothetical protein
MTRLRELSKNDKEWGRAIIFVLFTNQYSRKDVSSYIIWWSSFVRQLFLRPRFSVGKNTLCRCSGTRVAVQQGRTSCDDVLLFFLPPQLLNTTTTYHAFPIVLYVRSQSSVGGGRQPFWVKCTINHPGTEHLSMCYHQFRSFFFTVDMTLHFCISLSFFAHQFSFWYGALSKLIA